MLRFSFQLQWYKGGLDRCYWKMFYFESGDLARLHHGRVKQSVCYWPSTPDTLGFRNICFKDDTQTGAGHCYI